MLPRLFYRAALDQLINFKNELERLPKATHLWNFVTSPNHLWFGDVVGSLSKYSCTEKKLLWYYSTRSPISCQPVILEELTIAACANNTLKVVNLNYDGRMLVSQKVDSMVVEIITLKNREFITRHRSGKIGHWSIYP